MRVLTKRQEDVESSVKVRKLKNGQSYIDKTYSTGSLVEILSLEQWKIESNKEPSLMMLRLMNQGQLLPCTLGDGIYRWISPNALEDDNES
jgi:hypothetical protein